MKVNENEERGEKMKESWDVEGNVEGNVEESKCVGARGMEWRCRGKCGR